MIHDDILILSVTYYPTRFCKQVFLLTERFNVSLHELEFVTSLAPRSSCHVTIVAQVAGLYVLLELVPATITPDGKNSLQWPIPPRNSSYVYKRQWRLALKSDIH